MDPLQTFALYVGIFTGISGVVLAIVAMAYAAQVNRRADAVNDQTITSLQRVEADVRALSADTNRLIKAAWDKMLNSMNFALLGQGGQSAEDLAAGILAELRALPTKDIMENEMLRARSVDERRDILKDLLSSRLSGSVEAQILAVIASMFPGGAVDFTLRVLKSLSPEALALIQTLAFTGRHLTVRQAAKLVHPSQGHLRNALEELRTKGLLVPLRVSRDEDFVLWCPRGTDEVIRAALLLVSAPPPETVEIVKRGLAGVKYATE